MKKTKVLHVVSSMEYGGVQTWLVDLIKEARPGGIQMDILTYSDRKYPLAEKAKAYGSRVFVCTNHRHPWALYRTLRHINRTSGPYTVVHAHNMAQNGMVLWCAEPLGIPIRISHSHNDTPVPRSKPLRRLYHSLMRFFIFRFGTHLLAGSSAAGERLYGKGFLTHRACRVLPCGRDFLSLANDALGVQDTRHALGIPEDAKVIGHIGRFSHEKNHTFLLDMAAPLLKNHPDFWLILVGDGPLKVQMEAKAKRLGIASKTLFTGARNEASRLLREVIDVLVFPSHSEGLGLVPLEAQSAGKPCLLSTAIPSEVDVVPDLIARLPLEAGIKAWQDALTHLLSSPPALSQDAARLKVAHSVFSIERSFSSLRTIYEEAPPRSS
ncbi:MAG: glycosyltransferase [Alphaproteobacteria bacterium]|nr:glycosyltransferase [Alphaproteobacteria bacterium]